MRDLLDLLRNHAGLVFFGFVLAFLSSFGQTYFIALSVPEIQASFGLSHGAVGSIFSVATLASGLLMIWVGATLDKFALRAFAAVALAGLCAAALALSLAGHVVIVGLAVFGLRLFGQGMLSHASITSTARLPAGVRGRAMGTASLGFQAGTALFPLAGVALISSIGWTDMWRLSAMALGVSAAFVIASGIRGRRPGDISAPRGPDARQNRLAILRDRRFLILVPAMLGPSAIGTGYFFHQRYLADFKGWSLELLGISIAFTAFTSAASAVAAGGLVDRMGAVRVSRFYLLPLAMASLIFATMPGAAGALLFFGLLGLTAGASNVVITALLVEVFGVGQIGMIRALAGSVMVIASAITPGVFGIALDQGIGAPAIALACAAYLVGATLLNMMVSE